MCLNSRNYHPRHNICLCCREIIAKYLPPQPARPITMDRSVDRKLYLAFLSTDLSTAICSLHYPETSSPFQYLLLLLLHFLKLLLLHWPGTSSLFLSLLPLILPLLLLPVQTGTSFFAQYYAIFHCTVLSVLYCTVLYCTVLSVLYCTVLSVLYCTVLYCTQCTVLLS